MIPADDAGVIPPETLGDRLGRALRHAGVSTAEMAEVVGVTVRTVNRYMSGGTPPTNATLRVWALRCSVPYTWLLTGKPLTATTAGPSAPTSAS